MIRREPALRSKDVKKRARASSRRRCRSERGRERFRSARESHLYLSSPSVARLLALAGNERTADRAAPPRRRFRRIRRAHSRERKRTCPGELKGGGWKAGGARVSGRGFAVNGVTRRNGSDIVAGPAARGNGTGVGPYLAFTCLWARRVMHTAWCQWARANH